MENRWPVSWVYHTETHRRPTRHLSTQAARVSLCRCLLDHTCRCVQSLSRGGFRDTAEHAKNPSSHAPRAFTSIGADTSIFTYGRTSTRNFLLRFGSAPRTSFHYLAVPHRWFGRFCALTGEVLGSVALLCSWWQFGGTLNGFIGVFIRGQTAICLEPLWAQPLDGDSVDLYGGRAYMCTVNQNVFKCLFMCHI